MSKTLQVTYDFSSAKYNNWSQEIINEVPIITEKIAKSCKVPEQEAPLILVEALRYLDLVSYTKQRLTPSILVDYAWHEFILCTVLYEKFCKEKFEKFIHHHPGGRTQETINAFNKTVQHYIRYIGKPNEKYWGDFALQEWKDSQCGSCSTS